MKGRKIIPDELKKIRGTDQPCRLRPNSLKIRDLINLPMVPRQLKGVSKDFYRSVGYTLLKTGILNSVNLQTFIELCFYVGLIHMYMDLMNIAITVEEFKDIQKLLTDAVRIRNILASEFGLTPASAGKIIQPKKEEKNRLDKFLNA